MSVSAQDFNLSLTKNDNNVWLIAPRFFPTSHHRTVDDWVDYELARLCKGKFGVGKHKTRLGSFLLNHVESRYGVGSEWFVFYLPNVKSEPKTVRMFLVDKRKAPYDDLKTFVEGYPTENMNTPVTDHITTTFLGSGWRSVRQIEASRNVTYKVMYGWDFGSHYFLIEYSDTDKTVFYNLAPLVEDMVYGVKLEQITV